jgi:hypothetical protein
MTKTADRTHKTVVPMIGFMFEDVYTPIAPQLLERLNRTEDLELFLTVGDSWLVAPLFDMSDHGDADITRMIDQSVEIIHFMCDYSGHRISLTSHFTTDGESIMAKLT